MPELEYTHDSNGGVTIFDATGHRYERTTNPRGRPTVTLIKDEAVVHSDVVNLDNMRDRIRFGNACPASNTVTTELLVLSRLYAEKTAKPKQKRTRGTPVFSDTWNAELLVMMHGANIRYNAGRGIWLHWTGTHWQEDRTGHMQRISKDVARAIPSQVTNLGDKEFAEMLSWAKTSLSENRRGAMIRLAQWEDGVHVHPDELDADIWALNLRNGTVDLQTGAIRPHNPDDLITRVIPIDFDPDATCPTFDAFLKTIMGGDQELVDYVWRLIGYSLSGSTREQIVVICFGTGSNGKSTLLSTIRDLLCDYAREADADSFMEQRGGAIREDIADLDAARFVAASETADGKRLSESLIKKMTGGERLRARRLYENGYEFLPQFKVWLATNHRPDIRGSEHAIWRRIRLIPFEVTITDAQKDRELPEKLRAEFPGILAKAVRAGLEWQRDGLSEPAAVRAATESYRRTMDIIGNWIEDRCELDRGLETPTSDLYADYVTYCEANGDEPIKKRTFGMKLSERGCGDRKSGSTRYRTGISLLGTQGAEGTQTTVTPIREKVTSKVTENHVPNVSNVPSQKTCWACDHPLPTAAARERGYCDECAPWVEKSRRKSGGEAA